MNRDAAGDDVDGGGGTDHDPGPERRQVVPEEAEGTAEDEAAAEGADADRDRAGGRERADRADREQAVEDEDADDAGRDQRRQLVEGAVADPPMVVVVEPVELEDEDPRGAEERRPEERPDFGADAAGGDGEQAGDQHQPVGEGEQAAQEGAAAARLLRSRARGG